MKTVMLATVAALAVCLCACRTPISPALNSVEGEAVSDHRELKYRVWLPPGYEGGDERYPILVWFHGGGENQDGWGREGRIGEIVHMRVTAGALQPFIVVSPSAGSFTPIYRSYETLLIEEVIPKVREEYRTTDKIVAYGHSMGGLSALTVSLRNPGLFDAVALASPFAFDTRPWDLPEEKRQYGNTYGTTWLSQWRHEIGIQFDEPEDYEEWDPFNLVRKNGWRVDFPVLLTSGDKDPLGLYPHNQLLHERMETFGLDHEWYVQEGVGHGTVEDPYVMLWLNDKAH